MLSDVALGQLPYPSSSSVSARWPDRGREPEPEPEHEPGRTPTWSTVLLGSAPIRRLFPPMNPFYGFIPPIFVLTKRPSPDGTGSPWAQADSEASHAIRQ